MSKKCQALLSTAKRCQALPSTAMYCHVLPRPQSWNTLRVLAGATIMIIETSRLDQDSLHRSLPIPTLSQSARLRLPSPVLNLGPAKSHKCSCNRRPLSQATGSRLLVVPSMIKVPSADQRFKCNRACVLPMVRSINSPDGLEEHGTTAL